MDREAHLPEFYEPIPDDAAMGKCFRKLQPQQRAFVLAYLDRADENASAAARAARYGQNSGTIEQAKQTQKITGYRLIHDPRVIEAIKELAQEKFRVAGYRATATLLEIMKDVSHKDRFKAAERVLAQNGMGVALQVNHNHTHSLDEKSMIEKIARLARDQGLDPIKLLGSAGAAYTDAEFEVIAPALTDEREPAMSSAGLEDLL